MWIAAVSVSRSIASGPASATTTQHLFMLNRGILMTPFHNMALISPQTSFDDVDVHAELFEAAVAALVAGSSRPRARRAGVVRWPGRHRNGVADARKTP